MTDAVETAAARLRRNGKQQSCEPCRLRKQSCSHTTPCSRCIRHSRNCIYVDAPMSRERKARSPLTPTATVSNSSSPRPTIKKPAVPPPVKRIPTQENPLTLETGTTIGYSRTHTGLPLGYVGSTGYSAILDEAKAHIGMNIWELQDAPSETLPWGVRPDGSNPGKAFCRKTLAWLPSGEVMEKVRNWMRGEWCFSNYHLPSVEIWHRAFWDAYKDALEGQNDDALDAMIDELTLNTRRPLPINPTSNSEWLASYVGHKSRWELIGEMFIMCGNLAALAPDTDPVVAELLPPEFKNKKKSFATSMLECADICLYLCDELDISSNFQTVGLLARCVTLQSVIMGDSSYDLWKRVGQVANAVTGLGLHRKLDNVEQIAPLYVEQRTRTFASAYMMIVGIAVFLGRPPALSRRYVSIPLPTDVPESAIIEAKKMSDLDHFLRPDGWNVDRRTSPMTMVRAFSITSYFRDEVLEISLGQPQYHDVGQQIKDLRYRVEASRNELPPLFSVELDKKAFSERPVWELSCMVQMRLNHLQIDFLIERIEHDGRSEQRFLRTAEEMLRLVVVYWTERDRFPTHRDEVHWFISFAGIPAASALAITLFKQTTNPYSECFNARRPEIIQNLSLFVACLDWVRPEDGNYVLCGRVRKMIRHILDRVLLPSIPPMPEQDFSPYNLNDISLDNLPPYGVDFTGWLGGIDAEAIENDWTSSLLQCNGRFS